MLIILQCYTFFLQINFYSNLLAKNDDHYICHEHISTTFNLPEWLKFGFLIEGFIFGIHKIKSPSTSRSFEKLFWMICWKRKWNAMTISIVLFHIRSLAKKPNLQHLYHVADNFKSKINIFSIAGCIIRRFNGYIWNI